MGSKVSNRQLVCNFVNGATKGESRVMVIKSNKLYSLAWEYSPLSPSPLENWQIKRQEYCIAVRKRDRFVISNKARYYLKGACYSYRTSQHIGVTFCECLKTNKDVIIADGWADKGKPIPTHKTTYGIIRAFKCRIYGYTIKNGQITWRLRNNKLFDSNGNLVAVRKYVYKSKHHTNYDKCDMQCDVCPAKFLCLTSESFGGYIFYIAKGEHEKLLTKYLVPSAVVENLPIVEPRQICQELDKN